MFKTSSTAQQVLLHVGSCAQEAPESQTQPVEISIELLRQVGGGTVPVNAPKHGW